MPVNLKEIIVASVMPVVKIIGKSELENVLQSIQDHNSPEVYKNTLKSIHSSFLLLKDVALKSKNKIDDGIIDLVLEAVEESAEDDDITL